MKYILALILGVALVLRTWSLGTNPPELFADEVVNIASAQSLATYGHDLLGARNFYFSDGIEARPPVYGYLAYVSTRIFGVHPWSVRLPGAILGVASIYVVYLIANLLFGNNLAGIWAALVMTFMPWHIHFSRVAWGPAAMLFPLLFGMYLLIKFTKDKKTTTLYWSALAFGIGLYTYLPAPFLATCMVVVVILFNSRLFLSNWRKWLFPLFFFLLLTVPYFDNTINNPSLSNRAKRIFTFGSGVNRETLAIFGNNYLANLSPDFFVVSGDPNWRHGARMGVVGLVGLVTSVLGLIALVINKQKYLYLLFSWLLIYPLPAALTDDGVPHAPRSLWGVPVMAILAGYGIYVIQKWGVKKFGARNKYLIIGILTVCLIGSSVKFVDRYFTKYPILSQRDWEYGSGQSLKIVKQMLVEHEYGTICITNIQGAHRQPLIFYYLGSDYMTTTYSELYPCLDTDSIAIVDANSPVPVQFEVNGTVTSLDGKPLYLIITHYP